MVELLIAVAVLGGALLPIVSMANHNVEMLKSERARLLAEALCHDILERVGRNQTHPDTVLAKDKEFLAWRTTHPHSHAPQRVVKTQHASRVAFARRSSRAIVTSHDSGVRAAVDR